MNHTTRSWTRLLAIAPFAAPLVLGGGCASEPKPVAETPVSVQPSQVIGAIESLPEPDRSFVQQAAGANQAAIQCGRVAMMRGSTDAVRNIGQQMVDEHTAISESFRKAAREDGIVLPIAQPLPEQQQTCDRLSTLSGPEFDQAYLQAVTDMQRQTIGSFQLEALQGRNPHLSSFANKTLPTLNERARMVQRDIQNSTM